MKESFEALISNPIPVDPVSVKDWKQVEIIGSSEPLVGLGLFSDYECFESDAIYFGQRLTSPYFPKGLSGRLITPFVRQSVAEKLKMAQQTLLPEGHIFLIWDAYRPLEVQKALFETYKQELSLKEPNLTKKELRVEAQKFVSIPSKNPKKPSPHNTGGVVDLTIMKVPIPLWREIVKESRLIQNNPFEQPDENQVAALRLKRQQIFREFGEVLEMGTLFDYVGPETETNYYEKLATQKTLSLSERNILLNRRLLFNTLKAVGFENYEEEWWHFSYGDQMWGKKRNKHAIYGAATLTNEAQTLEELRYNNYLFQIGIIEGKINSSYCYPDTEEMRKTAREYMEIYKNSGDPRIATYPQAIAI